jgi:hypothetical protein
MTDALVGPLPTIHFQDGTRLAYQPPRNTLDNRYAACTDHHPACDCREASMAEARQEMLAEQRAAVEAAREVLRGHATFAYLPNGETDYARRCQCTGCQIARSAFLLAPWHQVKAGVPTERPADWEAPR